MKTLKIKKLHEDAIMPTRAYPTDAGLDLYAAQDTLVNEGTLISTGIAVGIPEGFEGTVRPKSGLTSKTKLRVQIGTVDAGYTGEIKVIADVSNPIKIDTENVSITRIGVPIRAGDKIAQLVISPVELPQVQVVEEFESESARGTNGFGSTGR